MNEDEVEKTIEFITQEELEAKGLRGFTLDKPSWEHCMSGKFEPGRVFFGEIREHSPDENEPSRNEGKNVYVGVYTQQEVGIYRKVGGYISGRSIIGRDEIPQNLIPFTISDEKAWSRCIGDSTPFDPSRIFLGKPKEDNPKYFDDVHTLTDREEGYRFIGGTIQGQPAIKQHQV